MVTGKTQGREQVRLVADIQPLVDGLDAGHQPWLERGGYRHDDALT